MSGAGAGFPPTRIAHPFAKHACNEDRTEKPRRQQKRDRMDARNNDSCICLAYFWQRRKSETARARAHCDTTSQCQRSCDQGGRILALEGRSISAIGRADRAKKWESH